MNKLELENEINDLEYIINMRLTRKNYFEELVKISLDEEQKNFYIREINSLKIDIKILNQQKVDTLLLISTYLIERV